MSSSNLKILGDFDVTRGQNSPFSIDFARGPYHSAALPRCLWLLCPRPAGALSDDFVWRLSDVCLSDWRVHLSVAYIGPKLRTERPRKTKIGAEVAHVTRDSDTTFKIKRSKVKVTWPLCSPPCWSVRRLQRWAWERVGHATLPGAHGGGEGRCVSCARLQLVIIIFGPPAQSL